MLGVLPDPREVVRAHLEVCHFHGVSHGLVEEGQHVCGAGFVEELLQLLHAMPEKGLLSGSLVGLALGVVTFFRDEVRVLVVPEVEVHVSFSG